MINNFFKKESKKTTFLGKLRKAKKEKDTKFLNAFKQVLLKEKISFEDFKNHFFKKNDSIQIVRNINYVDCSIKHNFKRQETNLAFLVWLNREVNETIRHNEIQSEQEGIDISNFVEDYILEDRQKMRNKKLQELQEKNKSPNEADVKKWIQENAAIVVDRKEESLNKVEKVNFDKDLNNIDESLLVDEEDNMLDDDDFFDEFDDYKRV